MCVLCCALSYRRPWCLICTLSLLKLWVWPRIGFMWWVPRLTSQKEMKSKKGKKSSLLKRWQLLASNYNYLLFFVLFLFDSVVWVHLVNPLELGWLFKYAYDSLLEVSSFLLQCWWIAFYLEPSCSKRRIFVICGAKTLTGSLPMRRDEHCPSVGTFLLFVRIGEFGGFCSLEN